MSEFRLRIEYAKAGRGAFLSHLEVIGTLERVVRRANLAYAVTQGFHPHMKMAFGPALPVGTGSRAEYADVWLTEFVHPDDALHMLKAAAPALLPIVRVEYVNPKLPSLTAAITTFSYRVIIVTPNISASKVEQALSAVRLSETIELEHKGKKKVFDPAFYIPNDVEVTQNGDDIEVDITLRVSEKGSLPLQALIQSVFINLNASFSHLETERTACYVIQDDGTRALPL